ncbi:MAG TPA: flagellar basal body-associated FliL family protein [Spirochaetota bacterium]|jgi:flagellar basal body-associated protein FliL|nr:flagellar basal body-associated FliL family protein [Spirochaetota bacterium]OQA98911.1 MAG: flagellar basal body-associated protein FliL [Spirochaetes bacterium ADurb.Bin218]HOK03427.1 flagellar basal body-associated FliL family protein [Spirochaetota bacterium]HOK92439.1 flagellar basal body-associated FliL family protein [Spirochaetota bacterium]HON15431.1 flagellar basal body-associated FliL family protein [Spirochaetota bacterium]
MADDDRDLAEEESGGSASETSSAATSKIVKILLYVAGGIILVLLVTGISYLVSTTVTESKREKSYDIIAAPPPEPLATFELPPFSKSTADAEPHFIKMTISLAYEASPLMSAELANRRDEIQHIVNVILQGKTVEDLKDKDDMITLSEEIKAHINLRLIAGKIKEVYFKEYLVN